MNINEIRQDVPTIEAGKWVDGIPGMGAMRLRVRGLSCKLYQATLSRLHREVPKSERERDGSILPEAALVVMGKAIAQHILLEWDGIDDGVNPMPYDAARAKAMLIDPEWRPFLDAVVWAATVVDNTRSAAVEDLEKN